MRLCCVRGTQPTVFEHLHKGTSLMPGKVSICSECLHWTPNCALKPLECPVRETLVLLSQSWISTALLPRDNHPFNRQCELQQQNNTVFLFVNHTA